MRKMVVRQKEPSVFYPDESREDKIYAGIDDSGCICIAMNRSTAGGRDYVMTFCCGACGPNHNLTSMRHYRYVENLEYKDLGSVLLTFAQEHNSDIYEFDTFLEFCQWVVEVLSK